MRLSTLLLLSLTTVFQAVEPEERERLRDELSRVLRELGDQQERLFTATGTAGISVPAGVQIVLTARRAAVADWQQRVMDPALVFPVEEVDTFREGVDGLCGRLAGMVDLIGLQTVAAERWPGANGTPESTRYHAFLSTWIAQGLGEVAAGAEEAAADEQAWRRHRRHELVLQAMDSLHQVAGRWPSVPPDAPVLREFLTHAQGLRNAAEARLHQPVAGDDDDLERDEAILWSLGELVQLVQTREERRTQYGIPADAPLWIAYEASLAGEERALRASIAHRRAAPMDDPGQRREEELQHERDVHSRLSGLAWESFEIDLAITDRHRELDALVPDVAVAQRGDVIARVAALGQQRTDIIARLEKALGLGERADAVRAKSALRILDRDHEALVAELTRQRERTSAEQEWRSRAAEPGVVVALAKFDAAWTAVVAAAARQREADHAAISADLARELAEIEAEAAQHAAERSRQAMEQAQEALESSRQAVIDVLENPPPTPEGDARF